MKRKILAVILTGVMAATVLAGCAAAPAAPAAPAEAPAAAEEEAPAEEAPAEEAPAEVEATSGPITINLLSTWTQGSVVQPIAEELIAEFEAEHPGVTIVHDAQATADLRTKLTVQAASGELPDISWCVQSYSREFMKDGLIIDWKEIAEADPEWKAQFSDAVWAGLTEPSGEITLAPMEAAIDSLYYNATMFEEHGWEPPTTWDEFIALCDTINAEGIAPLVTGGKDNRFAWMASAFLARAAGLDNFKALCIGDAMDKWDDPQYGFVEAVNKFKQMVDAGAFPNGVLGMSATEADQMFANGEAAMYYEGAWKVGNFESAGGEGWTTENVHRIDWPAFTDCADGNPGTRVGGCFTGLIVRSGLDPEKEALCIEFAKKVCSPEFGIASQEKGGPIYPGVAEYDESTTLPLTNELIKAYRSADSYIPSMDSIAPPPVDLAIKGTAFPGIITGEFTAEQAVAEVQKAAEDYVAGLSE